MEPDPQVKTPSWLAEFILDLESDAVCSVLKPLEGADRLKSSRNLCVLSFEAQESAVKISLVGPHNFDVDLQMLTAHSNQFDPNKARSRY